MSYVVKEDHELGKSNGNLILRHGDVVRAVPSNPIIKPEGWTLIKIGDKMAIVPSRVLSLVPEPVSPTKHVFVLSGLYYWVFCVLEPAITFLAAPVIWVGGADNFHHALVPLSSQMTSLTENGKIAVWQLANCYFLLSMMSALVFPAVRKALQYQPEAQERIIGASLTALAIADLTHVALTLVGLPPNIRQHPSTWNIVTHGNVTITVFLFLIRMSWFLGIGRTRYWYGKQAKKQKAS